MDMNISGLQTSFYEIGLNDAGSGSEVPFYEQVYASLNAEMRVISRFMEGLEGDGNTIEDVASLNCTTEKEVKEVIKSAQSVIKGVELLDDVDASSRSRNSRGWEEDSTTDQTLRNMRSTYITQVEAVLNVVAPVERWSVDAGDFSIDGTDTGSDTSSIIDMRRRLNVLRLVDPSANPHIQSVGAAGLHVNAERVIGAFTSSDMVLGLHGNAEIVIGALRLLKEIPIFQLQGVPRRFNFDELLIATASFSEKLGDGGFGSVYQGTLPPRTPVAVKRMNAVDSTHRHRMKQFEREVLIISQLQHENLIELRGWCEDPARKEYILVYEFMCNGSLDKLLFDGVKRTECLSWPERFNILAGIADALAYLHDDDSNQQVIHGDIKCANILLDYKLNAKLADFGLSRLVDPHGEAYTVHVAGSRGYIAPELLTEGKFTAKSDVFAFGAVVLEVVCGRRNWPSHADERTLTDWVGELLGKGNLLSTVDTKLCGSECDQMATALVIGLACCDVDYRKRPAMRAVVDMLAGGREDELKKIWKVKEEENGWHDRYERDMTPALRSFDEQWNTSAPGCLYYEASSGNSVLGFWKL